MKDLPEYHKIFLQAKRFEEAATMLFNGIEKAPHMFIPAIVNATLSLELYLKAISQKEKNSFNKTHNIKDLYKGLNKKSQEKISDYYCDLVEKQPINNTQLMEVEKISKFSITSDLETLMDNLSNLFIEFRYIFEELPGQRQFIYIDQLRQAVNKRISDLSIDQFNTEV